MANVLFKTGTQAQYDALTTKNENALYWLLDTKKLYKGELLFAVGTEATTASAGLLSATDKAKLDALVTGSITDIQALDNSILVETEGTSKKLKVKISLSEDNLISLEDDGLNVSASKIASTLKFKSEYNPDTNKIVTEKDIAALEGAMHFRGVFNSLSEVSNPVSGDIAIVGSKEFVYGGSPEKWSELGDEGIYLTIATAEADYLKKSDAANIYETKENAEIEHKKLEDALNLISLKDIAWGKNNAKGTKYEVISAVDGFLTDESQNDLRVYIPKGSHYELQSVGEGGQANQFYMTVRAWSPRADVTGCRKGDYKNYDRDFTSMESIKVDEKTGRPYVDFWLAIAYTQDNGATWKEYADLSTDNKYIGYNWMVEWYVGDKLVSSGSKRITLVNTRDMFYNNKDWYIPSMEAKINENASKLEEVSSSMVWGAISQ